MQDNSFWFYTLSTIAQTCAAILALGGTFAVFRLTGIQKEISDYKGRVRRVIMKVEKHTEGFYLQKNARELIEIFNKFKEEDFSKKLNSIIAGYEAIDVDLLGTWDNAKRKEWCDRMKNNLEYYRDIQERTLSYTKLNFPFLIAPIVGSVLLLAFGQTEASNWDTVYFLIVVLLAVASVVVSGISVWSVVTYKADR